MSGYKYGVVGGPGQDLDFLILPRVYYSWSNLKPFNERGSTAGYQAQSPWRQGPEAFSGVKIVPEEAEVHPELPLVARQSSATEQTGEHWKPKEQTLLPRGLSVGGGGRPP